jgi:hypothetical protein
MPRKSELTPEKTLAFQQRIYGTWEYCSLCTQDFRPGLFSRRPYGTSLILLCLTQDFRPGLFSTVPTGRGPA